MLRRDRPPRFGGTLAGTITLTAGLGGMGGAQPLAVTMNDGVALVRRGRPRTASSAGSRPATSTRWPTRSTTPSARCTPGPGRASRACRSASSATPPCVLPQLLELDFPADIVTDQTSAHDPLSYVPADLTPEATAEMARTDPDELIRRARERWPRHCQAMVGFLDRGAEVFDYGNSLRTEAQLGGFDRAFDYPGFLPAYIRPLFCEGKGPFRWVALSGDPADIAATDRAVLEEFPDDEGARTAGSAWPASGWPSRACRPASAGWATASATASACASTRWCARGELSAPIVIGRDHLDSGSVASPYRETEAMLDGSDAIADWPLLNALVNTRQRGDVGQHPPRRRGRHRPLDPRRHGVRRRRHRPGRREAASGC